MFLAAGESGSVVFCALALLGIFAPLVTVLVILDWRTMRARTRDRLTDHAQGRLLEHAWSCEACGYDRRANPLGPCPECGAIG